MPAWRTAAVAGTLALASALAVGCGKSEEDQVRDTLTRFERATAAGDYRALCRNLLAKPLVQRLDSVGLPCEFALRRGFGSVNQPGIDVRRVKVRGDVAFALVTATAVGQPPAQETIRLVKEDDDWRVAALARAQPPAPPRALR